MSKLRLESLSTLDDSYTVMVSGLIDKQILSEDGSSSLIGYTQSTKESVGQTIESRLRKEVFVTDFGAKCDGSTDDTEAFQYAIDFLSTGGKLHIPGGQWVVINGVLTINSGITIEGDNVTLIKTSGDSSAFFIVNDSNTVITGVNLTGIGYASSSANSYAIVVNPSADRFCALNMKIREVWGGMKLQSTIFTVENVEASHFASIGAHVDQSQNIDGVGIFHNFVASPASGAFPYAGIKLEHAVGIIVSDCELMGCNSAIACDSGEGKFVSSLKINNTYMDSSNAAGLAIYANGGYVQRVVVSNSWLCGTYSGAGMRVFENAKVYGLMLSNCELNGNKTFGLLVGDNCDIGNFDINGCVSAGNSSGDVAFGLNNKNFTVSNCRLGLTASSYAASPFGLNIAQGCSYFNINGGMINNLQDSSYPASNVTIESVGLWGFGQVAITSTVVASQDSYYVNVGVPGARLGDMVSLSLDNPVSGISISGYVLQSDVVKVRIINTSASSLTLPSCNLRAKASRHF